jgi:hypothetical protein
MPKAVHDSTVIENLCEVIAHASDVRLISVCEGRVWFASRMPFEPPVCSLPLAEFSARNIQLELQKFTVEEAR